MFHELSVAVVFHLTDNGDVVAEFLYGKSVDIRHRGSDYIEAYVPIHHLGMASELDGVLRVRVIQPPHPPYRKTTAPAA